MITSNSSMKSAMTEMPKPALMPKPAMPGEPKIEPHSPQPNPKQELPSPVAPGIRFEISA